jgi:hypothetical protein
VRVWGVSGRCGSESVRCVSVGCECEVWECEVCECVV